MGMSRSLLLQKKMLKIGPNISRVIMQVENGMKSK